MARPTCALHARFTSTATLVVLLSVLAFPLAHWRITDRAVVGPSGSASRAPSAIALIGLISGLMRGRAPLPPKRLQGQGGKVMTTENITDNTADAGPIAREPKGRKSRGGPMSLKGAKL